MVNYLYSSFTYLVNFKETGMNISINFITQYVLLVFEPNKVGIEKERMLVPITKKNQDPF